MGSKKKSQTSGYRYYMGMQLALCQEADAITEIQVGERVVWSGATTGGQIFIDAPNIFGGDRREGGVRGAVDVMMGSNTQTPNDYLQARLGAAIPAFRGVVSMVLRRVMIAANNPYAKPWAPRVRRIPRPWSGDGFAPPSGGANPAAIIYECLTRYHGGIGFPDAMVGPSLVQAASILQDEDFGLNLVWTRQTPVRDFIQIVLDHIGGVLYQHPRTGQFELKLVRGGYDIASLPVYGPHNVLSVDEYQRAGWGETVNEISVVYTDRATWKPRVVAVQNLANIQAQGGVVTKKVEYPGITRQELAARVAQRDLRAASTPLAKIQIRLNRSAWEMFPGDLFVLNWPELKIHGLVLRVGAVEYGTLGDGAITVQAVEDVFSLDATASVGDNTTGFVPPSLAPVPPDASLLFEVPYWEVARNSSPADLAYTQATDTFVAALAVVASDTQLNFQLHTGNGIDPTVLRATDDYAPTMILPALPQSAANIGPIPYSSGFDLSPVVTGDYGYILDSAGAITEAVEVLAIDTALGTVTLARGVLDTVPVAHPAGRRLIIVGEFAAFEGITRAPGETVHAYIAPVTGIGVGAQVPVSNGPAVTLTGRQGRPYPPGNVRVNAIPYPLAVSGEIMVSWSHRDRLMQTGYIVHQDEGNIGPEPGTTYTLRIYGESFPPGSGALLRTYTGIAGTNQTYPSATEIADAGLGRLSMNLTIELFAVRGGLDSWRKHRITVYRAGYGVAYGQHYGGL